MSKKIAPYHRPQAAQLARRLVEPRRFIQVVAGPRQVGKSTLVGQVLASAQLAHRVASADEPTLRGPEWIAQQWEAARLVANEAGRRGAVLALDEIQKIPRWSESIKRLWDEDTRTHTPLRVVLLGSAPLLLARGLSESLAGRFELLHLPHWSLSEMGAAFGWSVEQFIFYGGYPGAAPLVSEPRRWARYVLDSLVETSLSRAHARGQAGAPPAAVRTGLPLLGPGALLQQDARSAAGCRQHDDPRALPGSPRRCGHGDGAREVRR